jgi:GT2 family glycosyltransferase
LSSLVSVIVLNWNGDKYIHRCVESVINQSYNDIEIIVVDNASNDGSLEKVEKMYPNFIYIENSENYGFSFGMNQGITVSSGEYVIPLNLDVYLHKDYVKECIECFKKNPLIGAVGGKELLWKGDELTNESMVGEGIYLRKRFQGIGGPITNIGKECFMVTGSFPIFRKSMLENIYEKTGDYYDEMFETGWEDIDLFFRMHLNGWKCWFTPRAYGWHVGSASDNENIRLVDKSFDYQVRVLRNRYYTIIKNVPKGVFISIFPYLVMAEIGMMLVYSIKYPKTFKALQKARKLVKEKMAILREKRRLVQQSIKVNNKYIKSFFIKI